MRQLKAFQHFPGAHCGSTALNDVARFYGLPLTEPLCLGLGEGLGFTLIDQPGASPSRMLLGRNRQMESRFFENMGTPFEWRKDDDNARAWTAAKRFTDLNIPVLLRTDLRYFRHYDTKTHFTGHVVVLAGYDDDRAVAAIADAHFQGLQDVPLADLEKARASRHGVSPNRNHAFPVARFEMPHDRVALFRGAIVRQAQRMLAGRDLGQVVTGTLGMDDLAASFSAWKDAPDWQWCARFGYQMIEKRGTGGGNFRKLYSEFLSQAESYLPGADLGSRARQIMEIADRWSDLAAALKAVSEAETPRGFLEAGRIMGDIAARERAFFTGAAALDL